MGAVPLVLVLAAAGAHAGWNLIAKRAGGGLPFVWLCAATGLLLYAPLAAVQLALKSQHVSLEGIAFMAGSGTLHSGYFSALQEGYAVGDLSLVYPLARGTGPLLSVIAAIVILHERASTLGLLGAGLIAVAILSLTTGARREGAGRALAMAGLTGGFIAAYTIWDAHAVRGLHQPVIVYFCGAEVTRVLLLAPIALRRRRELETIRRTRWRSVLGVAVLSPGAYILVLAALTLAPVTLVAPAREVSIIIGVAIGANALGEGHTVRRALAACAIVAGIALLAVA